jgi:hypothetical protein
MRLRASCTSSKEVDEKVWPKHERTAKISGSGEVLLPSKVKV